MLRFHLSPKPKLVQGAPVVLGRFGGDLADHFQLVFRIPFGEGRSWKSKTIKWWR